MYFAGNLERRKVMAEFFEAFTGLTYTSPILRQVVKVDIIDMSADA